MEKTSMGISSRLRRIAHMNSARKIPAIDMAGVATRLEAIRSAFDLSKDTFAKSFGIDPSSYTKMTNHISPGREDRTKPLKSEHAFAIAERWGVSMDFIYRGDLSRIDDSIRAKLIAALNNTDE
jgi:hypothetical protein